jgi:thiol-disulfide isomerase/thioredoxin
MLVALTLWLTAVPQLPILKSPDEIVALVRQSERPTVVHFWATWCEACILELPEIRRLEHGLQDLRVPLLWLSLDHPDSLAKVAAFMQEKALLASPGSRAALLDAPDPGPITARFDPHWQAELPATFVMLQSGAVVASHLGPTPVDVVLKEVRTQLNASHAGQSPPARRTK